MDAKPTDSHAGFVEAVERNSYWTIGNPTEAFRLAFGGVGVLLIALGRAASFAIPLAYLGFVAWKASNYWLLFWTPVLLISTLGASDRTMIGALPATAAFFLIGVPLALFLGEPQLAAAASAPGAWVLATLTRVIVASAFLKRLVRDPAAWSRVHGAGLIRLG